MSKVLVAGSTGYVGGRLVPELLDAGHSVRCIVRNPAKLGDAQWRTRVDIVHGDVTDEISVDAALEDIEVVYYLVHSMTGSENFEALDRSAAACVARAAQRRGTGRSCISVGWAAMTTRTCLATSAAGTRWGGSWRADPRPSSNCGLRSHRIRVGEFRDVAVPRRGASRHGGPEMGVQSLSTGRHPRRARCAGGRSRGHRDRAPRRRDRRPGCTDLSRDDADLRGGRRSRSSDRDSSPAPHPAALVPLDQPGHPTAGEPRSPARRQPRGGRHRPPPPPAALSRPGERDPVPPRGRASPGPIGQPPRRHPVVGRLPARPVTRGSDAQ